MTQVLQTGDENAGQVISIPIPDASPLVVRAVPASSLGLGASGAARATNAANSAGTAVAATSYVPCDTNGFIADQTSPAWTFTTASALWTYNGLAGRRFLFTYSVSYTISIGAPASTAYSVLDLNGALESATAASAFTQSATTQSWLAAETAASIIKNMSTTRLVNATPGMTLRPLFAYDDNGDFLINRMTLSWAEVGTG